MDDGKKSNGKILEIGTGGSTILLLGASGIVEMVSIDRDSTIANKVFNKLDVKKRTNFTINPQEKI